MRFLGCVFYELRLAIVRRLAAGPSSPGPSGGAAGGSSPFRLRDRDPVVCARRRQPADLGLAGPAALVRAAHAAGIYLHGPPGRPSRGRRALVGGGGRARPSAVGPQPGAPRGPPPRPAPHPHPPSPPPPPPSSLPLPPNPL